MDTMATITGTQYRKFTDCADPRPDNLSVGIRVEFVVLDTLRERIPSVGPREQVQVDRLGNFGISRRVNLDAFM